MAVQKLQRKKPHFKKELPFTVVIPRLADIILESTDKEVIQKIYLFGSYAYGNPTKNSDLDICIILDNMKDTSDVYVNISKALFYKNIIKCDLLVYRDYEFYHGENPESIENTIMEKGNILYER
jgi:predicted nucleotidyltransferase